MLNYYIKLSLAGILTVLFVNPTFAQCPITVNAGEDILLCPPPTPVQLNGDISGDYLNFNWIPSTGLTGANTLTPTANVTQNTTYVLRAKAVIESINLIDNGDFEGGNSSFTTSYTYSPGDLWPEGTYEVLDNPQSSHANFAPCTDHTGGGQMMAVNGNGGANTNVWCQTISIAPNTEYAFTAWATSLVGAAPAVLQFSVNSVNLGTPFAVSPALCNWQQFYALWNSGPSTTANICVVNQNTALSGNDFALDDIGFSPVCVVTDTVKITIATINAVAAPAVSLLPCEGAPITLNGVGSSVGPGYSYQWGTSDGNIVSGATTLNPVVNAAGQYTLTVTYTDGTTECTKTATVTVVETPNPLVAWVTPPQPLGCGGTNVTLLGNSNQGNVSYEWSTINGNIVSGMNSKNCIVNVAGTYTLVVTNLATGCTATTDVALGSATNPPVAIANGGTPISCLQTTSTLSGTGSSSGAGINYTWQVLAGSGGALSGPVNGINATASAAGSFILGVTNTVNGCTSYDTVAIASTVLPPNLALPLPDTFTCVQDTVWVTAHSTTPNASFAWTTSGGSIAGGNNIPTITTLAPGIYNVTVTNPANGCTTTSSVTVLMNQQAPVAVALPADSITCQQTSVILSGSGSSTGGTMAYQWQGGNIVSGGQTLTPTVNAAGIYTLQVTNQSNGCTHTATTTVFADANAITAVANAPDTLDCVTASVQINANGSTNGTGFLYQWTTTNGQIGSGAQSPTAVANLPGTYTLLLTNPANGCTSTAVAVVEQNLAPPAFSILNNTPITCAQPTVTITAQSNQPGGNYSFNWATTDGQIVGGSNAAALLVGQAGTYTVTITNQQNGCTSTASTMVIATDQIPVLAIAPPPTLTCNTLNTALQLSISGVNGPTQIQWTTTNGQITANPNGANPTVNAAGTYAVTVTNPANGCTAQASVLVQQDTAAPAVALPVVPTITCTNPTQTITATVPATGVNVVWSTTNGQFVTPPANNPTVTVNQAGLYQIALTNTNNGCTSAAQVTILADQTVPVVNIATPSLLTCTQLQTNLLANISQAGTTFNTQWSTTNGAFAMPANAPTTATNTPGTYQVMVTNTANGCSAQASVNVAQDTVHPVVNVSANGILTCAQTQIGLAAMVTGASGNIPAVWTTAGGQFVGSTATLTPQVSQPGTYTLTATDAGNGCSSLQSVVVQQNIAPPSANAGTDAVLLCSTPVITLNGSISNEPGLTINWTSSTPNAFTGPTNTATPSVDAAGTFILSVVNPANGCSDRDTVIITADVNQPVVALATPAVITCTQTQVTLSATATSPNPSLNLQWSATGGGVLGGNTNSLQPIAQAAGTYTLVVSDNSNGCSASATIAVSENKVPPVAEAGTTQQLTCDITSASLSGSSSPGTPVSFAWTTANGFIVSGQNQANPIINEPGVYALTVTNTQNGCTATDQVTITENIAPPVPAIATPAVLTCAAPQTVLTASSAPMNVTAVWTTANGTFISGQNTLTPTVSAAGTYILLVENPQNGCTATVQTQVTENKVPPAVDAGATVILTCSDPSLSLSGTSATGTNVVWSTTTGNIVSGHTGLSPMVNRPGTYTITATNSANGCTASDNVTVSIDTLAPTIAITPPAVLTCLQQQILLQSNVSNAGISYSANWSTVQGNIVSGPQSLNPVVNQPAPYTLTVVNPDNGCSATASVTVAQNTEPPVVTTGPGGILHCNQPTWNITSTVTQAGNNPAYQWTTQSGVLQNNTTAPTATAAAAGVYRLMVTNLSNGCTNTATTTITAVLPPQFDPAAVQPTCLLPLGSLDFGTVTGGAEPFTFSFDNGNTFGQNLTKNGLAPGNYSLVVEDTYGCTAEVNVTLEEPVYPSVSLPALFQIEQGDSVRLLPQTYPPAPLVQQWSWTETLLSPVQVAPGLECADCPKPWVKPLRTSQYTVTITDQQGCTASATSRVEVDTKRKIYVPNIITPEGDAPNNKFTIFGKGVTDIELLQVFDRWGALVWEGRHLAANDVNAGWDGTKDDRRLDPAVFVWQAIVTFPDGTKELYSGDVTVAR